MSYKKFQWKGYDRFHKFIDEEIKKNEKPIAICKSCGKKYIGYWKLNICGTCGGEIQRLKTNNKEINEYYSDEVGN